MSTNTTIPPTSAPLEPSVSEAPPPVPSAPPTTVFEDHDGAAPPTSTDAPLVGRGDPIPLGTTAPGICYVTSPDGTGTTDQFLPCDAATWTGTIAMTSTGATPTLPVTGAESGTITGVAFVFVATGAALLAAARRRHAPVA